MPPWKDRDREDIIPSQHNTAELVRNGFAAWVPRTLLNFVISPGSSVQISLPSPVLTASTCQRREGLAAWRLLTCNYYARYRHYKYLTNQTWGQSARPKLRRLTMVKTVTKSSSIHCPPCRLNRVRTLRTTATNANMQPTAAHMSTPVDAFRSGILPCL